ncbi:Monocarboxylate transporter [Wickerhamomyces ciferrii]|uniref:Monocarboxylate transporter n=1 Tax=Wickerhamomyces ciferrii (strain ATCC 14091 / BCRC 22168 / CBS 111 / JCM 3599 / NBRC 0793 / NRRL Y-1031 F-60-10) TaxID=1206466 RepID=K0KGE6_WICCF|nr:Monocarboxylate transporter [Wickerhamomyces ciferrii]CCH40509.1 Monocarboxylate transporter [Wickerhamomyces ciferrii]
MSSKYSMNVDQTSINVDHEKNKLKATNIHTGEADDLEFPEGGRGWLMVLGSGIASAVCFGMVYSYGVFQTHYETELFPTLPSSKLSIIGALQTSIIYLLTPFCLPLAHAFGIRSCLAFGCIMKIIALFGLSTTDANSLWKCYVFQAVFFGIGGALLFSISMAVPSEWFKRKRASAFGISAAFVGVGGVMWPIIFKQMIHKYGFSWTVKTIGFIYIPLSIGIVLLMPQKIETKYLHKAETVSNSEFNLDNIKSIPQRYRDIFKNWRIVSKNFRFVVILLSNLLGILGSYPAIFYIDFFGSTLGPNFKITAYITVLYVSIGFPGRVIPAIIADHIGRINVLLLCLLTFASSTFLFWIPAIKEQSMVLYVIFVAVFGFTAGPLFSLYPASLGQLFGIHGSEARIGLFFLVGSPGPIIGCLIAGSFIPTDSSNRELIIHSFYKLVIYSGVILMGCVVLLGCIRLSISKKPWVFI